MKRCYFSLKYVVFVEPFFEWEMGGAEPKQLELGDVSGRAVGLVGVEEVSGPLEMHSSLGCFCEENKPCMGPFAWSWG